MPGAYGDRGADPVLVAGPAPVDEVVGANGGEDRADAGRNAAARKSHTKATRKKLRALGIKLTGAPPLHWGKTSRCSTRQLILSAKNIPLTDST